MAVKRAGRPKGPPTKVIRLRASDAKRLEIAAKRRGQTPADYLAMPAVQERLQELLDMAKTIPAPKRSKRSKASKRSTARATKARRALRYLSRSIAADGLPTEFKLFAPGWNDSTKGAVLFDERAAELVMTAYRTHGTDLMIDLEHQSLLSLEEAASARADACDARGWFSLDLRPDGSLWAVVNSWTPDGERRLREKSQRYISPAFLTDDTGRVVELINCAIVAMPATHGAEALVN